MVKILAGALNKGKRSLRCNSESFDKCKLNLQEVGYMFWAEGEKKIVFKYKKLVERSRCVTKSST